MFASPNPFASLVPLASLDGASSAVVQSLSAALKGWWASSPDLQALTSDGLLWHVEAPEGVDLPYVTFFTVAETERDDRTTGYAYLDSVVQFSAHAETDVEAEAIRKAVRAALKSASLSVNGSPAWYCLPGGQSLSRGEGFGPHGSDCWVATVDATIPWRADLEPFDPTVYGGPTTAAALQSWWAARADLQALTSDGRLWRDEDAEGSELPYVTFAVDSESEREGRTTGYAHLDSLVRIAVHAGTDAEAESIRRSIRSAAKAARFSIDGVPTWYGLPGDQSLALGEGFGPDGRDLWIAAVDLLIPIQADA